MKNPKRNKFDEKPTTIVKKSLFKMNILVTQNFKH